MWVQMSLMNPKVINTHRTDGRNDDGTFAEGNTASVGHGRPHSDVARDYMGRVPITVTRERWDALVESQYQEAMKGGASAVKFISDLLIGKPPQYVEVESSGEMPTPEEALKILDARIREVRQLGGTEHGACG